MFKTIIGGSESAVQRDIELFRSHFKTLPPDQIAFPRGITNLTNFMDNQTIYKKQNKDKNFKEYNPSGNQKQN